MFKQLLKMFQSLFNAFTKLCMIFYHLFIRFLSRPQIITSSSTCVMVSCFSNAALDGETFAFVF